MDRTSNRRSNIAWFKLAEFVSRGERERALSIYRLLSHSISDKAFVAQLRGDILRAFNDKHALQAYEEAAEYYEGHKQMQAAVLYEEMSVLDNESYERAMKVLNAYQEIGWLDKTQKCAERVIDILLRKKRYFQIHEIIRDINLPSAQKAELHERFVVGVLGNNAQPDRPLLESHIVAALEGYDKSDQAQERVSRFFGKLASLDEEVKVFAAEQYPLSIDKKVDLRKIPAKNQKNSL